MLGRLRPAQHAIWHNYVIGFHARVQVLNVQWPCTAQAEAANAQVRRVPTAMRMLMQGQLRSRAASCT